jgi:hypothetical protein
MKRFAAFLLATIAAAPPVRAAAEEPFVDPDLALAIEYSRACPELVLDNSQVMELAAAPQRSMPSMLADGGDAIDTMARTPAPEPEPVPPPPPPPAPDGARPAPPAEEEVDCAAALAQFGPAGTRIRGLLKVRTGVQ